jgi:enolase
VRAKASLIAYAPENTPPDACGTVNDRAMRLAQTAAPPLMASLPVQRDREVIGMAESASSSSVAQVHARQILDSRGHPTLEVDVVLASGARGRASVPAGTSTGRYEVLELRDGGDAWHGRAVQLAIANVRDQIAPHLIGVDVRDQDRLDETLVELDGTSSLSRLGANAVLAVSLAAARAAANEAACPLWRHLASEAPCLPVPWLNALEGGVHADNRLAVEEFMLVPLSASTFTQALRLGAEIYHELGFVLLGRRLSRAVGDEGGYAARLDSSEAALDLLLDATRAAGYEPGADVAFAIDAAAGELADDDGYRLGGETRTTDELIAYWADLCDRYPIVALEDGLGDEDWSGWRRLTDRLGSRVQLVADDLFATHPSLVQLGIDQHIANAVLVKPNQVGTLTRTLETVSLARAAGYTTVMSHRSGDTEDTTIADLAVATACPFIKPGAPARSEHAGKYNRLLRIEEELGAGARFAGNELPASAFTGSA